MLVRYLLLQNNRPDTEGLRTTNIYCPMVSLSEESGRGLAKCSEKGVHEVVVKTLSGAFVLLD